MTVSKKPKKKKDQPETLEERVHRHLSDINSEITDEDIRSVRTAAETGENSTNGLEALGQEEQKKPAENEQE